MASLFPSMPSVTGRQIDIRMCSLLPKRHNSPSRSKTTPCTPSTKYDEALKVNMGLPRTYSDSPSCKHGQGGYSGTRLIRHLYLSIAALL
jgi:hypothetical protein